MVTFSENEIGLYPAFKEGRGSDKFFNILESIVGVKFLPFTCGRSAIVKGLSAFGLGRMDEILVPPYIGQCVLSALSRTSFPTMTPSIRTKAILVFHQFGFPQNLADIESEAQCNGWTILNDCANTLFTQVNGRFLIEWGDFSIISLSKLYLCGIGGGFYSNHSDIYGKVFIEHERLFGTHIDKAEQALKKLIKINKGLFGAETIFEINGLYGYLPDLVAFPQKAYSALPSTRKDIEKDINHRKNIWATIKGILPDYVPVCKDEENIVPFAVPVSGKVFDLEKLSIDIRKKFNLDAPVLHFDFKRNMLNPDYKKSLVIGCHEGWSEELVMKICETIKRRSV
jgi:hypothetical protein